MDITAITVLECRDKPKYFNIEFDGVRVMEALTFAGVLVVVKGLTDDFKAASVWNNSPKSLTITYKFI